MTALPASTDFTDSAVTEAQFKTAITNQRDFLAGLLGADGASATALETLGALGSSTVAKSTNYTVIASDRGKVIEASGAITLSLTAAATLTDGFCFAVINTGSGVITIDPSGTETIDGATSKTIAVGAWVIVSCNGTGFYTMGSVPTTYEGARCAVITSSATWPVPDGISQAVIVAVGGGGGSNASTGGNGGYGGVAIAECTNISGSLSITIGAAGSYLGTNTGGSGGSTSVTGTGVSITATGGGGGFISGGFAFQGASGSGSVSTGTALRLSNISKVQPYFLGDTVTRTSGSGTSRVAWSVSSDFCAGAGGQGPNTGGVDGVVLIFY